VIQIDQTEFGEPEGNSLQACIASILEVPIDSVPPTPDDLAWLRMLAAKLYEFHLVQPLLVDSLPPWFTGYVIGYGKGPRGLQHAVVMRQGELVHDPHPDRAGLETLRGFLILVRC
jgi:hypothetical protein